MSAITSVYSMINGTRYNHTFNSSGGTWDVSGNIPKSSYNQPDHVYQVVTYAQDAAGNTQSKTNTLRVIEKTPPVITVTSPTTGALLTNNKPVITWSVTDDDSGVADGTIGITIDAGSKITGSAITKTAITSGYQCTYTPTTALSDGSHTIKFDASDNDGNVAATTTVTIKIDTVPPTLNVTGPTNNLITNKGTVTVSGTTNDATSSPVTLKVNGTNVTVKSDGTFTTTITLSEGSNTITIIATDAAGKSTTVTRTVVLDTVAPTFVSLTITPDPVNANATFKIVANITD